MSYQVLARKWRPRNFQEMVGQEPILRMLTNALDHERLHHAYLFTGTRGVGKTTLARILAKCLNCETGISSNPCGKCSICESIDAGRFLDLIEVDAASRTKVEDTREILDNVQYAATQGRYKIYLIDEVHMLSGHSFNALLKTLEEPPAHVKFLLATTDPKRLPITILSRCLQFNLKRVPAEQIAKHLEHICKTENIAHEMPALELLSEAADGSMRDALSLLDQAIAYCGNQVSAVETRQMLGSIEQDAIFRLLDALAENNGALLLSEIAALAEQAPDFNQVLEELLKILHQVSIAQIVKDFAHSEKIKQFATRITSEDAQLYYQIALIGRRDLPLAPNARQGFEMVMLRMLAFRPDSTKETPPAKSTPHPEREERVLTSPTRGEVKEPTRSTASQVKEPVRSTPAPEVKESARRATEGKEDWAQILSHLNLTGLAQALAANCSLIQLSDAKIQLGLTKAHEPMLNKKLSDRIEEELTKYFKKKMQLENTIITGDIQTPAKQKEAHESERKADAKNAIENDSHVQKIQELFGASLDLGSIEAV